MKPNIMTIGFFFILLLISSCVFFAYRFLHKTTATPQKNQTGSTNTIPTNPLSITAMRQASYPGSDLHIEQTLTPGSNYNQYIASYISQGLTIYGLLTVPQGQKPASGWPVIIFNHGYIAPTVYRTTERYLAYVDAFARNGYIVFKSDYRGNGSSQGKPTGAYYSPDYTIDVLNALASVKKYKDADPSRIGMWGHSMGGNITLRSLVINSHDIKAAVIWGGVVGSYNDLVNNWHHAPTFHLEPTDAYLRNNYRSNLFATYGTPQTNPTFWHSIDPTFFTQDITTPIQLHHGDADEEVPVAFSQELKDTLDKNHKTVEFYTYPGSDHNISQGFSLAMQRSINFFDRYVKGGENK